MLRHNSDVMIFVEPLIAFSADYTSKVFKGVGISLRTPVFSETGALYDYINNAYKLDAATAADYKNMEELMRLVRIFLRQHLNSVATSAGRRHKTLSLAAQQTSEIHIRHTLAHYKDSGWEVDKEALGA